MTRAQPKSSPKPKSSATDDYARGIARAIAKGRLPPFNADLDQYCERSPRQIFAAFAGAARHMPPAGQDEALAIGYLFLLQRLLEHLRYRTDRGYEDAAKLIAEFQADVVAQVEAGHVVRRKLALVGGGLPQSKIPASPARAPAGAKQPLEHRASHHQGQPGPPGVRPALAGLAAAQGG